MAGTVTITGASASEPTGQRVLGPITIQGSIVIGDTVTQALALGDNTIPIPTGSTGVVLVPPPTGSATLLYRTSLNSGDSGLPISPAEPFVHTFPSPAPTVVILNASAAVSAFTSFWVW